MISGKSWRNVNDEERKERVTLMPDMSLEADEKRVDDSPSEVDCLLDKSIVMLKCWRKSNPKIGLEI